MRLTQMTNSMNNLQPKPGVLDLVPYVAARAEPGRRLHQMSNNESAIGPSAAALEAFRSAAADVRLYPDGGAHELRGAIAKVHGLDAGRVVCGNGSDELLTLLAHAYVQPGHEVVFGEHAFLVYRMAALASGGKPVAVSEPNLRVDVDAMLAAVTPKTRIVYIANPNNPTGTYISASELKRLHAGLAANVLFVIDSAYAEYIADADYDSGVKLVSQNENVVMTRTFSKAYGLAGLRVGWAYCPENVLHVLNRVRGPFNVSVAAQGAATAALQDRNHLQQAVEHNAKWRSWLLDQVRQLGLRADDSAGNFILIHFADAQMAKDADRFLLEHGIAVRPVGAYGLPLCLRMTVGLEEANRAAISALAAFMETRR
jgi:histidinol-phosphate aminotransferase